MSVLLIRNSPEDKWTEISTITPDLKDYATKEYVNQEIQQISLDADLSEYAKLTDIPENVSDLNNDLNFATENYVTQEISKAVSSGEVDLSDYYTKIEIDTNFVLKSAINDFITMDDVENKGYLTEDEVLELISNNLPASGEGVSY